jgi:hypothetical protein
MPLPAVATLLRTGDYTIDPLALGASMWLDAKRSDVIFTSNAGTGAISDGAAAGFWGDISGNALDMTSAADDTTRPTWTSNSGNSYMAFDGSNDLLRRTSAPGMFAAVQSSTFITMASASTPTAGAALFGEGDGAGGSGFYYPLAVHGTTGSTFRALSNNSSAGSNFNGPNVENIYTSSIKVLGVVDYGGVIVVYLNGLVVGTLNYTRGATTVTRVSLGGFLSNSASAWCVARVYELVMLKKAIDPQQANGLCRYLMQKAGV